MYPLMCVYMLPRQIEFISCDAQIFNQDNRLCLAKLWSFVGIVDITSNIYFR